MAFTEFTIRERDDSAAPTRTLGLTLALEKLDYSQQVPKPPAPAPGVPPGNIPPLPPDIPVPDPAPPPVENPGDVPLPPITDPDVIEPGDPNPTHPPIRVRSVNRTPGGPAASSCALNGGAGSRKERSNLFASSELDHRIMEAILAYPSNADGVIQSLSVNDLNPQNWRTDYVER